jgi:hypothetical protein
VFADINAFIAELERRKNLAQHGPISPDLESPCDRPRVQIAAGGLV